MDKINQVGKYIKNSKQQSKYSLDRYSEIFPLVEKIRDSFNTDLPFTMEFKIKVSNNSLFLDLDFNTVGT